MRNKTLLQVRTRYFIYTLICVVFWSLYISGLYIMWSDNEMDLFMNYIFTLFGLAGMIWINMIFHEKFIENYT